MPVNNFQNARIRTISIVPFRLKLLTGPINITVPILFVLPLNRVYESGFCSNIMSHAKVFFQENLSVI